MLIIKQLSFLHVVLLKIDVWLTSHLCFYVAIPGANLQYIRTHSQRSQHIFFFQF